MAVEIIYCFLLTFRGTYTLYVYISCVMTLLCRALSLPIDSRRNFLINLIIIIFFFSKTVDGKGDTGYHELPQKGGAT